MNLGNMVNNHHTNHPSNFVKMNNELNFLQKPVYEMKNKKMQW
jgi:hypothetical protein